jgi:hypothetical protein
MSLEEDVTWLLSICKKPESLKYLEPSAHAFSIFLSMQGKTFDDLEIAKLSMVGIVATTARLNDNDRFHNLDPQSFLQVANMLLDEEDNGENYNKLVSKIVGETSINIEQEDKSDV